MTISWRTFWWAISAYLGLEALSLATYQWTSIRPIVLLVVLLGLLVAAWRRPALAGMVVIGELIVGGKGYLLFASFGGATLSLRMGLFLVLLVVAASSWWRHRHESGGWRSRRWLWPALLLGWVAVATGWGLLQHYPPGRVLTDMNALVFLLALPALAVVWRGWPWRRSVLAIIMAGVTVLAIKGWLMMVVFGQGYAWTPFVYRWIRNTGVGEIAPITDWFFRVFFQSQVYALCGLWVAVWGIHQAKRFSWSFTALAAVSILSLLISLSRSFWVGAFAGALVFVVMSVRQWRTWWRLWPLVVAAGAAWILFTWAVNFPSLLPRDHLQPNAIAARLSSAGSWDASAARKNQLRPLLSEISRNPIVGRGYGAEARYFSTDPRVRGWRTTSAFELGYLDWWLKTGLIGLLLLGLWLWRTIRGVPPSDRVWIWPILASLLVVHAFTPYLNHPLGLGIVMLFALWPYASPQQTS